MTLKKCNGAKLLWLQSWCSKEGHFLCHYKSTPTPGICGQEECFVIKVSMFNIIVKGKRLRVYVAENIEPGEPVKTSLVM